MTGWMTVRRAFGLLRNALEDLHSVWVTLLTTDLLYKLVAVVVLTPLASGVATLSLWLGGSSVLADKDILSFALKPLGLVGLMTMVAVSLASSRSNRPASSRSSSPRPRAPLSPR